MVLQLIELSAFLAIILWPVIPLYWIPLHCKTDFFRRIGVFTYLVPFLTWLPYAYIVFSQMDEILAFKIAFPLFLKIAGGLILIAGLSLQLWTGKLLGMFGLMGIPELSRKAKGKLIAEGPFKVVRHPTYLSHTLIYFGIFLMSGTAALGAVTFVDVVVINIMVIPLEERELSERFGADYETYKKKVRSRFLPW